MLDALTQQVDHFKYFYNSCNLQAFALKVLCLMYLPYKLAPSSIRPNSCTVHLLAQQSVHCH